MSRLDPMERARRRALKALGFIAFEDEAVAIEEAPTSEEAPAAPLGNGPAPVVAPSNWADLGVLGAAVRECHQCTLCGIRRHAVAGGGVANPKVFFIAETPLLEEDANGQLHGGEIGDMYLKILKAMKLSTEEVYYTNAVKCRPTNGRPALAVERDACAGYLRAEIALAKPKLIVTLGLLGLQVLLPAEAKNGLSPIRGRWLSYQGIPVMATFALPYVHNNTERKRKLWDDLKMVLTKT